MAYLHEACRRPVAPRLRVGGQGRRRGDGLDAGWLGRSWATRCWVTRRAAAVVGLDPVVPCWPGSASRAPAPVPASFPTAAASSDVRRALLTFVSVGHCSLS